MSSCVVQVLQLRSAQSDESLQCLCAQVFQRLARAPAPARMDRPRGTWKHPAARQESLDGRKDLRRCVRCGFQSYIRKVGCVVFGCVAYYMNKPVEKRQSPWKRGRGESTSVYTPQEWYQKMSWVEEKAIRSSLQEPDSDSESDKKRMPKPPQPQSPTCRSSMWTPRMSKAWMRFQTPWPGSISK